MPQSILKNLNESLAVLNAFIADKKNIDAIEKAGDIMVKALQNKGKIISCGNGGSMADAIHFAEELTGRFRKNRKSLAAIAISDPAHITCVANDYGFDSIFSRFVAGVGQSQDVLLAISTSGNSVNVINAAKEAKAKGMTVIGLTGKDGGELAALCTAEIRVPWMKYADRIQEIHIKVIHALIHFIENNFDRNN